MSGDQQYNHDHDNQSSLFFPSGNSSDVNSKIMLIAIITLSTVVVVVIMLHVYVRYILRRQARARVAFRGIGLVAHVELEPPKRGLEPAVIASLPILKYVDTYHGSDNSQVNPECTICIGSFEDGQMIRVLPTCKHHFHAECIDKWLESHSSCPVCRHEVELISPLSREPVTRSQAGAGPTSAPPLETTILVSNGGAMEGTSDVTTLQSPVKVNGTVSRLSSFRRMLSMDRSSLRNDSCTQDGIDDLERQ